MHVPRSFSPAECARLGEEIFDRRVKPLLTDDHKGLFVAVDVISEAFEVNADDYTATSTLLIRKPDAEIFLMRAGYPTAYRMGMRLLQPKEASQ